MIVIRRTLKLTGEQYAHLQFVQGQRPSLHTPLDMNVYRDMRRLAMYLRTEVPVIVEDEVRDAMEMVGG
jgi:hypothetical protein